MGVCAASQHVSQQYAFAVQTACPLSCLQCVNNSMTASTTKAPSMYACMYPSLQTSHRIAAGTTSRSNTTAAAVGAVLGVIVLVMVVALAVVMRKRALEVKKHEAMTLEPLLPGVRHAFVNKMICHD